MVVERGEIWWANLGARRGSAPAGSRPVLVVQADAINRSRIATVVVTVITSNLTLATAPGNVVIRAEDCGLPRDSVVNVSQLLTIDKSGLVARAGRVPFPLLQQVDEGMRLVLSL